MTSRALALSELRRLYARLRSLAAVWALLPVCAVALSHATPCSNAAFFARWGGGRRLEGRPFAPQPPFSITSAEASNSMNCVRCLFPGNIKTPAAPQGASDAASSPACPAACLRNGAQRIPSLPAPPVGSAHPTCFILSPSGALCLDSSAQNSSRLSTRSSSFVHAGLPSSMPHSSRSPFSPLGVSSVFKLGSRPPLLPAPGASWSGALRSVRASDGRLVVSGDSRDAGDAAAGSARLEAPLGAGSSALSRFAGSAAVGAPPYSSPSAPVPAPADPVRPGPLTSDMSLAGRRMEIDPSGPLGQMQTLLREGIYKAGAYIQAWPQNDERDVDMLVTKLDETAAISPGQKTVVQLPLRERERIVRHMRATRSATIFLGYVDYREEGDVEIDQPQEGRSALTGPPPSGQGTKDDYMLIGYGAIAEPTEIHMLDKSGEIGLRIMGRVKIVSVLEASETNFRVRVLPHRDESRREGFVNPLVSRENIKALYSLYDRVNKTELLFRKLEGKMHQAHLVSLRPRLEDKVDEFINETSGATEQDIGEWVSFCAMDHHIDARARCWAMAQQDTELRLDVVRRSLEDKLRQLQAEVKSLKDQPGARDPDDVMRSISEEMPLNIKL
ncbi:hypothetical protein BESB_082480 [Besnoitia besnoiti]|uniref:Uncharacterized protein n=1 Tax=Besnoitia besnoiti TaxID=94643 RepID=A0A2A9M529_BESBE|nr:hypothetical protein BESB_082480 [Besnoitia besnoiti]PFH33049.1 hypothetical protein BESB_082480 [Besnoitia besnoiti]